MKVATILFLLLIGSEVQSNKVMIYVTGMQSGQGSINVAIYREKDAFPEKGKQFSGKIVTTDQDITHVEFADLEPGKYAVAVFHDENNNGKLDKNRFGIPTESYGFSNNARGIFSAPSFEDASFQLSADRSIRITVK
jgi:uncharacterized protein (DUF2141 family)